MKDMKKMMGGKKLSPIESKAKMGVLQKLKEDMQDMMGDKVAGLKKVTVASDDKEGLEEGLKKAKEMIHGGNSPDSYLPGEEHDADGPSDGSEDEEMEHEDSDSTPESEQPESDMDEVGGDESHEEIDAKIQELLKKKASLKK